MSHIDVKLRENDHFVQNIVLAIVEEAMLKLDHKHNDPKSPTTSILDQENQHLNNPSESCHDAPPQLSPNKPSKPLPPLSVRISAAEPELHEIWQVVAEYIERKNNPKNDTHNSNSSRSKLDWNQPYFEPDHVSAELRMLLKKLREAPIRPTRPAVQVSAPVRTGLFRGNRRGGLQELEKMKRLSVQAQAQVRRLELEKHDLKREVDMLKEQLEKVRGCREDEFEEHENVRINDDVDDKTQCSEVDRLMSNKEYGGDEKKKSKWSYSSVRMGVGIGICSIGAIYLLRCWKK